MITDVIVLVSVGFALVFVVAWGLRPDLREWIERPKHRFQDAARRYDCAQQLEADEGSQAR